MTTSVGLSDRALFEREPDPRRAYRVVDLFEQELCRYTHAPYAVAVNSCTNALFLALTWKRIEGETSPILWLPRRTYVGVLQAALNAGYRVRWREEVDEWQARGFYGMPPMNVWDFARKVDVDYRGLLGGIACLSFHAAKQLAIGRGGAILTDNPELAEWARAARMDGRAPGQSAVVFPGWHMPMPPATAALGLDILSRWCDTGYTPPPLPRTDYPDLSRWYP